MNTKKLFDAAVGDLCFGFRIQKIERVGKVHATVYTLIHEKTGCELLYSARQDDNKTFAIAFKTLPENHTGVFHILEHSVLNGSEKFPVKEPFVNLLQSSMQTFLNAMTYSDKTVYPVSSRNEKDFFNLMQVYLDAVFCPKIYTKPEIFMQEGWHYQMSSPEETPKYNGVVYSEMKGAFSDVDNLMDELTMGLLFPDTSYGYVSGGDPEHIPELSYEAFINTHKRFYHPTNAKIFLDGDMNIDWVLSYIDGEYLSKYQYRAPDFDFQLQQPVKNEKRVAYQVANKGETFAHLALGKILCKFDNMEKIYATNILCDYLTGTNESPLKRSVLERGLAQDIDAQTGEGIYQPYICIKVKNTEESRFGEILKVIRETIDTLCVKGLDRQILLSSLDHYVFTCREIQQPRGLALGLKALDSWLYDGNPLAFWDTEDIFRTLREKVDTGYFVELLKETFGDMENMSRLMLIPSETKGAEDSEKEREILAETYRNWTSDQRKAVSRRYIAMTQWQQREDTPEDLAKLPRLSLSDVALLPKKTETREREICGCKTVEVDTETNGIIYLNLYFALGDMDIGQLQIATVLTTVFGELSTSKYTALELQNKTKALFGGITAAVDVVTKEGELESCTPYLGVSVSMLEENAQEGIALLEEILCNSRYTEEGKILETLLQNEYACKQALISSGHSFAVTKTMAPYSAVGAVREALEGEGFVTWFSDYIQKFQENANTAASTMAELHKQMFCSQRLTIGYSGKLEDCHLEKLVKALPKGKEASQPARFPLGEKNQKKITIAAGVSYSAISHNLYAMGQEYTGSALVLSSLMSFSYLWNMVRVQGGAYGTGMGVRPTGDIFCYSYRDPNPEKTVQAYRGMPEFLTAYTQDNSRLDDIIIGTVNKTDPLVGPASMTMLMGKRFLKGTTYADLCKIRREILTTTPQDLQKLCNAIKELAENGTLCIVGGE